VIQCITYIHNVPRPIILVNTCHISKDKLIKSSRDGNEIVGSNDCFLIINMGMSDSYCVWYAQTQVKCVCVCACVCVCVCVCVCERERELI
jgi:hypothetical protein